MTKTDTKNCSSELLKQARSIFQTCKKNNEDLRNAIRIIRERITELETERKRLAYSPLTKEDYREACLRTVDIKAEDFKNRLARYFFEDVTKKYLEHGPYRSVSSAKSILCDGEDKFSIDPLGQPF